MDQWIRWFWYGPLDSAAPSDGELAEEKLTHDPVRDGLPDVASCIWLQELEERLDVLPSGAWSRR